MQKSKIKISIILLLAIGGFIAYFIFNQSYPVALVDSRVISARDFKKDYSGAYQYYQKMLDLYNKDATVLNAEQTKKEIQRAVLDKLIEDALIDEELKKEMKPDELDVIIEHKIADIVANQKVQKGAEILYGFSLNDFRNRVLMPQAKRETLEGRLFLSNASSSVSGAKVINDWLKQAKSKARVIILMPGFSWNGEKVI